MLEDSHRNEFENMFLKSEELLSESSDELYEEFLRMDERINGPKKEKDPESDLELSSLSQFMSNHQ